MRLSKKLIAVVAAASIFSVTFASCTQKEQEKTTNNVTETAKTASATDYTVNTQWLKDNLSKDNLIIIDARPAEAFKKGHIEGAVNVTWQSLSFMEGKTSDENWGTVLPADKLQEKLRSFGIDKSKNIVVYCDTYNSWGDDGRVVWTLRSAGIETAKMLDGGLAMWTAEGFDTTTDSTEVTPSNIEISSIDGSLNITTKDLAANLKEYKIIDTRTKGEFDGSQKYGELRGGHLPGAVNIEFKAFLNEDGSLKTSEEIEKILKDSGIEKGDKIVTYCTAGIRSAHMAMILRMNGYDKAVNYDESIYAWAADEKLPMNK